MPLPPRPSAVCAILLALLTSGCSLRTLAVNQIGNALAGGGTTFSSDDDPELIGTALPFSLKLMESLLAESPEHTPLLVAASRGFTLYAYAYVSPADPFDDPAAADRARRLFLRARDYGLRALSTTHRGFAERLALDPRAAAASARKSDVPALYWTAASWGLAIAGSKDDLALLADLPAVEALISRAAELDPAYDDGAIDTFLISFESSRAGVSHEAAARAREHFRRAVERSGGQAATPYVAAAEAFGIADENRILFEELLQKALAVDPDSRPEWRLQNLLAQRRARWLLANASRFFLDNGEQP